MSSYALHGKRHKPRGSDPSECDVWRDVATDPAVGFVNGSNMDPTTDIPNPVPLRFRLAVGGPNILTYDYTTNPPTPNGIERYVDHQIEIQGDVTGVSPGDIVFVLPLEYRHDHDVPCHTHDDQGTYVPCRLYSDGRFVYDTP